MYGTIKATNCVWYMCMHTGRKAIYSCIFRNHHLNQFHLTGFLSFSSHDKTLPR